MTSLDQAIRLWRAGQFPAARDACLALERQFGESFELASLQAQIQTLLGDAPAAIACLRAACRLRPEDAAACRRLGDALLAAGYASAAVEAFREAVRLDPGNVRGHNNLGTALERLDERTAAEACYRRALELDANYQVARFNLQRVLGQAAPSSQEEVAQLLALGAASGNQSFFERATGLAPGRPETWIASAGNHLEAGRLEEAVRACQRALAIRPASPEALLTLAHALYRMDRQEESLRACRDALAARPDWIAALSLQADVLKACGEREAALAAWERVIALEPGRALPRFARLMTGLPLLARDDEEVLAARSAFLAGTRELEAALAGDPTADATQLVGVHQPYFLAYQIENNRPLLQAYGTACSRLMSGWLNRQAIPRPAPRARSLARRRVGIVSAHVLDHSVFRAITRGWLNQLDRRHVEMAVFSLGSGADAQTQAARATADRFESGPRSLRAWVESIQAYEPDVLLYPEVGMDPTTTQLASLRLAPVQAVSWGHPETTGLPTMDYYLSGQDFEGPDAPAHYSERLLPLPGLGTCLEPPASPSEAADLSKFALRGEGPVLLCPGIAFKYGPHHDALFVQLARRLGPCRFWFFEYPKLPVLSRRLLQRIGARFEAAGLDAGQHLILQPWAAAAEFASLAGHADVLLDTIGFSGFNTILLGVESGLPIVTHRGRFLRGKFGAAILDRLGLSEFVAEEDAGYVDAVARLAGDAALRQGTRERMMTRKDGLYGDGNAAAALQDFLLNAH